MNNYELLSNFDLIELGQMMDLKLNVVSKDKLKYSKYNPAGYIINLDDSDKGGSHWVGLYINKNDACYFDSFGEEPPLSVIKYCRNKNLIFSHYQIQHLNQIACGYYCLAFLHFMNFNKSNNNNINYKLTNFIKPFDLNDMTKNDNILQNYFKNNVVLK